MGFFFLGFWLLIIKVVIGVKVEQGEVVGTHYTLTNGKVVNAFYGIPYATPPTHKFRFKEPQPLKPWPGVWNASMQASPCLQYDHRSYKVIGEEDCLYLNVFTPKLPVGGVSQLMDVFVYIHGGAFMFGSGMSSFGPDFLMENNDVVLVTINYRLGPLGFLSTGDNVSPGNNGLKDQVAALKWVHHNIIKFGGNPASVTITGVSAGGASVHYHYLSPLSEGLFQRGISLSGSVTLPWTLPKNVVEKGKTLAALLGCPNEISKDMIKCLQKRPGKHIAQLVEKFQHWKYLSISPFGPVIEPPSPNSFIDAEPLELIKSGKFKDLPWMISITTSEGLYPAAEIISKDESLKYLDQNWLQVAPHLLEYYHIITEQEKNNISNSIRDFYLKGQAINNQTRNEIVKMVGDRLFDVGIREISKLHAASSVNDVYFYVFDYRGKYSLSNIYANDFENYGVSHSDDIMYILKVGFGDPREEVEDNKMKDMMTSVWINFASKGIPMADKTKWLPLEKDVNSDIRYLHIKSSNEFKMETFKNNQQDLFWNNLFRIQENQIIKDEL